MNSAPRSSAGCFSSIPVLAASAWRPSLAPTRVPPVVRRRSTRNEPEWFHRIADPEIRAGVEAGVFKNLLPAATERVYPGHFTINADGGGYGSDTTWPGLDSWQMIGPYLHLGRTRLVLDYFDFVRASQRKDGNIPFAIFNGNTRPGGCPAGPQAPGRRVHVPPAEARRPARLQPGDAPVDRFVRALADERVSAQHPGFDLLRAHGPPEIFDATGSQSWLKERLNSVESAARFLLTLRKDGGLIGGSGFYIEAPPREGCDGITQWLRVQAFRRFGRVVRRGGGHSEGDRVARPRGQAGEGIQRGLLARGPFRRVRAPGARPGGHARSV